MKSILQLDRENQLDRQRRLLFCWCYARIEWHSAQTWRSRYWDAYSMIKLTVSLFVARLTQKRYYPAADMVWFSQYVPQWLYIAVLLWFTHAEDFPDGMALREPECTAPEYEECEENEKIYLSAEMQQSIAQKVREELLRQYRFQANNVDKDLPPQSRQQHRKNSGRFSHCQWNSEHQDPTHKRQAAASALFCIF